MWRPEAGRWYDAWRERRRDDIPVHRTGPGAAVRGVRARAKAPLWQVPIGRGGDVIGGSVTPNQMYVATGDSVLHAIGGVSEKTTGELAPASER
ncbi:MAG: hypothetical protein RLZZ387_626 [Chloroflexota bacterium]